MAKTVGKDGFLVFKKTFFAERPWKLHSAKLGVDVKSAPHAKHTASQTS
jgi:hypothetical protein